jgi:hypothetical protein
MQLDRCLMSSTDTLKSIYFVYFHSIMKYCFGGNSPQNKMIFTLQKRTVRIIADDKAKEFMQNSIHEIRHFFNANTYLH